MMPRRNSILMHTLGVMLGNLASRSASKLPVVQMPGVLATNTLGNRFRKDWRHDPERMLVAADKRAHRRDRRDWRGCRIGSSS